MDGHSKLKGKRQKSRRRQRSQEIESYDSDEIEIPVLEQSADPKILDRVNTTKQRNFTVEELLLKRQNLEVMLANTQLEESGKKDQHKISLNKYLRIEEILQAFLQYLECLNLETSSSLRLSRKINDLIVHDAPNAMNEQMSRLLKKLCEANSSKHLNLKSKIVDGLLENKVIEELVFDYEGSRTDFNIASQNFKLLLDNANLNQKQIDHLQQQYESILVSLQHSRCILDQELPNSIRRLTNIFLETLDRVGEDLSKRVEDRNSLSYLLKTLFASLHGFEEVKAIKDVRRVESAVQCNKCNCKCDENE